MQLAFSVVVMDVDLIAVLPQVVSLVMGFAMRMVVAVETPPIMVIVAIENFVIPVHPGARWWWTGSRNLADRRNGCHRSQR
jgi:hypothetical protein